MKLNRVIPFVMLFVLLAGVLAGCGTAPATPAEPAEPAAQEPTEAPAEPDVAPTEPAAAPAGGTLVIAMSLDDVVTLDPAYAGETTNLFIHINTYDTLVDIRPDDLNTIVPRLAESWEVNDDFTEFIFHLRPDAKFASGNPVTAEDVVFSWNRLLNVAGAPAFNLDGVGTVEAVDESTVKMTTAVGEDGNLTPLPQFLSSASNPSLGIQDSKLVKEHGGTDATDAATTDKAKEWLDQNSAGSGPFVLTKWDPKATIELTANKDYWKGAPYFDKVVITHVSDPTTQLQMLEKGDADMIGNLQTDLVDQAKANPDLTITVDQSLDQNYLAMTYKCPDAIKAEDPAKLAELQSPDSFEVLCKKEVRQAVAYAIDYEGIAQAVLNGYAARAPSIIPIGMAGVDPAKTQGRDLEKAKALLAEAGYADGVTFDLYYASNAVRDIVAAKIQSDLAEAGMTVNLKPLEQSVYLTQMRAQQLPMAFGGWTPDYLDVTMWTDYFGLGDRSIAFRMNFMNEEANKLATTIRTTSDPAIRTDAVEKLQDVFIEEMPFTMLYQNQYVHAFRNDLQGFKFHPVWFVDLFELHK
ncbi:MAG TPA: ABC transporter substrate-binding protein [Anaerolineales bacterium]|nr:ABC transporter substrate-binding protein [Anaerolineales bacterium]